MEIKSQKKLITGSFLRLTGNNIVLAVAISVCGLTDNLFVGQRLGKDALAAVGFFSPVTVVVGFSYVIILGTQVLTGNLVGAGETKKVRQLFVSSFYVLGVIFGVLSLCCLTFYQNLAALLGADGRAYDFLCDYIKGYAPGMIPQTLAGLFMALCPFNNDLKRSYLSIAAMIAVNVLGDWLLIDSLGLFGVGLASTVSSLVAFIVLLPGFFKKDKLFHFQGKDGLDLKLVLKAASRGIPSLMLTFGVLIRNTCFNYSLNHYIGASGVAVAGIMSTVSALTGAIPSGCYNSFSTLAGIYFGEEDRESLIDLAHIALRIGVIFCAATTALVMLLSAPLAQLFVPDDSAVRELAHRMFLLTFTYLVPCVIFNTLLQAYRAQNRMLLVNIMSFAETAVMGLFTLFFIQSLGSDAAWISNTVVDVICVIIVMISVVIFRGKLDFSMPAMLKLSDDFGAKANEYMVFSVRRPEDVTQASEKVIDFCMKNNYGKRISNHVGLCVEEMAVNVLEHGFREYGCYADIRVVSKDGELTVRVRDNCREFDPRKRMDLYDPAHPEKNIGIRIVSKAARKIDYYNNAGINTLIMKF